MKDSILTFIFTIFILSTSTTVSAEDINYRHYSLIKRYLLHSKVFEDELKADIKKAKSYIPQTFSEKLHELKAGTERKTNQCLHIKHSLKMSQIRVNTIMQDNEKRGLHKRLSNQRKSEYMYLIDEYKREALLAQKSCYRIKDSIEHMENSLEFLTKARLSLTNGFNVNNNAK